MNKLLLLISFSILFLVPVGAQQAFAGTLYTINESTGDRLESIDTDTLVITDIGSLTVDFSFGGLAYDPNSDTLYMIDGRSLLNLYEVDRNTGAAILIGNHGVTDLFGLAFDTKNNVLYATAFFNGIDNFYRLDVTNGQATLIGSTNFRLGGLAYDSLNDRIIGINNGNGDLYEINRNTAQSNLIFNGDLTNNSGLTYDPDKDLFWDADISGFLYSFDPNNGFARTTHLSGLDAHDGLAYLVPTLEIPTQVIGGKIIPIESVSLILAGAQSFSWMFPLVLSIIGIGLILVRKK